ncbi:MAG: efflux transporter outer membrane subunit [Steroidobacteraceae bacterium]
MRRRLEGYARFARAVTAGSFALMAGCTVGPAYKPPAVRLPTVYTAAGAPAAAPAGTSAHASARVPAAASATPVSVGAWWTGFGDPELSSLIGRALEGNLDLRSALSRVREAHDEALIAGAARLPRVNADASANRTRISQNSGISQFESLFGGGGSGGGGASAGRSGGAGFGLPGNVFTAYSLGLDASWETDLFGGVRRQVEAAGAEAEQSVWSARDSEVMVAAEVADDYLMLRVFQREMAIERDEIARQKQTLALIQARRRFGFVTSLDVHEQRALLAASQASVPDLDASIRAEIHGLGALLGQNPEALQAELAPAKALPERPPTVPVGLPSDLLRRRPDIRAAERALAASSAKIGVAVADLYPQFSLTGAFDFVSLDLRNLLDLSSRQSSVTGAISWPIFAGRQIEANIHVAEERNRQALYTYQETVIRALQDVEDALTRYRDDRQKNAALRQELTAALGAEQIALAQYRAGLINLTPVLSTQGAVLGTRNDLAQSDGALDRDVVAVYKALGGGWGSAAGRP